MLTTEQNPNTFGAPVPKTDEPSKKSSMESVRARQPGYRMGDPEDFYGDPTFERDVAELKEMLHQTLMEKKTK